MLKKVLKNLANPKVYPYQSPEWRKKHYRSHYESARLTTLPPHVSTIRANRARYEALTARFNSKYQTNIHWLTLAAIHALECNCNFKKVLHNGEFLTDVNAYGTKLVPIGRGKGAFWTWEDAAIDALTLEYRSGKLFPKTLAIEEQLFFVEQYNGTGYLRYHPETLSPYLWSFTDKYVSGKYDHDGKWNSKLISKQAGVVSYFLSMKPEAGDIC